MGDVAAEEKEKKWCSLIRETKKPLCLAGGKNHPRTAAKLGKDIISWKDMEDIISWRTSSHGRTLSHGGTLSHGRT